MNINFLRVTDKYAGKPVLWICIILMRFLRCFRQHTVRENELGSANSILIIKYFGMGSLLLASPAMRKLKDFHPNAKLILLTSNANRNFCRMLPAVDQVICLDITSFRLFIKSFIGMLRELKASPVDVTIDIEFLTNFSAITAVILQLLRLTKYSCGFNCPVSGRNSAYDRTVIFDHSLHVSEIFTKVINLICQDNNVETSFEAEKDALRRHANPDTSKKITSGKDYKRLILVNINASTLNTNRRWPVEYYHTLVDWLLSCPGTAVVLIGGKSDTEYVDMFMLQQEGHEAIINLCGKISIEELLGLFVSSDLFITNDSGPLHLAHVIGTTTVSFFGPETPRLYGPSQGRHIVYFMNEFCSPCINILNSKMHNCKRNECLRKITPDRVIADIQRLFEQQG